MTNTLSTDAARQLRKSAEILGSCEKHLRAHAEANAALHMASEVIYSPLCVAVTLAKRDIEQWLDHFDQPEDEGEAQACRNPHDGLSDTTLRQLHPERFTSVQHPIAEHIAEVDRKRHPEDYTAEALQREWS